MSILFFLIIPPPPRSTLFPYTTLFRSESCERAERSPKGTIDKDSRVSTTSSIALTVMRFPGRACALRQGMGAQDRKSTRLNSSHTVISYAVFCLKKKKKNKIEIHITDR